MKMQKVENWQWLEFEELPSTNDKAKELVATTASSMYAMATPTEAST